MCQDNKQHDDFNGYLLMESQFLCGLEKVPILIFSFSIADDNASSKQLVLPEEESKTCSAAEDVSGSTVASSSTHM